MRCIPQCDWMADFGDSHRCLDAIALGAVPAGLTVKVRFDSIIGILGLPEGEGAGAIRGAATMYFIRFILLCIDTVNDFLGKNCHYIAGAIAFSMFFSMFPLILAIISIWGFFLDPSVDQAELAAELAEVIPISSGFIAQTVKGVASAKVITGIASVLLLMWASSAAFGAIRKGINTAWGIQKTRPFIKERLIDIALVTGAGILMVMLLFVAPMASSIHKGLSVVFPDISYEFLSRIISQAVSPILSFSTFMILYRYMPNTEVRFRDVWPGALFSCLGFEGAKWGFLQYLNNYSVHNALYGSVGGDHGAADLGVCLGYHTAVRRTPHVAVRERNKGRQLRCKRAQANVDGPHARQTQGCGDG